MTSYSKSFPVIWNINCVSHVYSNFSNILTSNTSLTFFYLRNWHRSKKVFEEALNLFLCVTVRVQTGFGKGSGFSKWRKTYLQPAYAVCAVWLRAVVPLNQEHNVCRFGLLVIEFGCFFAKFTTIFCFFFVNNTNREFIL